MSFSECLNEIIDNNRGYLDSYIAKGGDINVKDSCGNTFLHYICKHRQIEAARLLIELGADVNARNTSGNTPLHEACSQDDVKMAELLIQKGAEMKEKININIKNNSGKTPFDFIFEINDTNRMNEIIDIIRKYAPMQLFARCAENMNNQMPP